MKILEYRKNDKILILENGLTVENTVIPQSLEHLSISVIDYNEQTKEFTDISPNPRIAEIEQKLQDIHMWFLENDWKAHKIALGEWERTDSRCIAYLEERALKRNLQDSLNQELNDLNV